MSAETTAWAALLEVLPEGWAASITHVPSTREWGCTVSPMGPEARLHLIQTDAHASEVAALRAMATRLRYAVPRGR